VKAVIHYYLVVLHGAASSNQACGQAKAYARGGGWG